MGRTTDSRQEYERWVEQWAKDLYRFAYRLCGRGDTAEDLVQETFYHAWRSMRSLRDRSRARAWLFQILRHRWSHYVRADSRRPKANGSIDAASDRSDSSARSPLAEMTNQETVQRALDAIDERYRLPLLMVFLEGMTCREAAEQLQIPLGTVLSRIHRARQALRERLGDEVAMEEAGPRKVAAEEDGPRLRLRGKAS